MGTVPFERDEKETLQTLIPLLTLILEDTVVSSTQYQVPFDVTWHSLPYGYDGGRNYSHTDVLTVSTADLDISISYTTSNPLTPDTNLQVQEQIFANITITFIEV